MVSISACLQAFFHRRLELVANLSVAVSVEYAPSLKLGLRKHTTLDLAVNLSRVLFNIERDWCTAAAWTH
jgi:hypothetical protein